MHASEDMPDLAHPFFLLQPGQFAFQTSFGIFDEEHEYEVAKVVQDLFEYTHNFYQIKSIIGLPGQRQFGLEVSATSNGELSKEYTSTFNIPKQYVQYKGLHAIEVFYQEHLKVENDKNKLALEVRFKGSPVSAKEANNSYPGKDISIAFVYSHFHDQQWRIYGDLRASVIGKKKNTRFDREVETVDAYSQFGNLLGLQWLNNKYWLEGSALFYLTTDYISRSSNYSRVTDKGFVIGGKLTFGYYLSPQTTLTIAHTRQGANFNVIAESTAEEKEFEIETQFTQLGVIWSF